MMKVMRTSGGKVLASLFAAAFLGWMVLQVGLDATGRSQGATNEVGRVDGRPITLEEYNATYQQITENARRGRTGSLTADEQAQLREQTWQTLVERALLANELQRRHISVSDDEIAKAAILRADTLVTPMNDSFVDLDLIGQVHPENYKITRPSFYAELIWNSRTQRAKETGKGVDWVVLRNRLQHITSHNLQRVGAALDELARRVGYRVIPGLGERVIYRELFPKGLTLLDLSELGEVGLGHIAARQELREMVSGLAIPGEEDVKVAAAG